ncbi:restriction endonuclease [Candidatus Bathyarchaeota archaeon]|jgi:Holliday junction resolvase-like predicted endonuclease|nr:restriction endonuclease [Candidatus Bathyarchaeota archaeon]
MSIERELIISLLKLTREGSVSHELINKEAKIPLQIGEELLQRLQNDGLVYVREGLVEADSVQRLKLAVRAVELGADVERVSSALEWQEFENMAAVALERNGYDVQRNLRFKHAGRKWEVDVVGCKKPVVISIDCKHWRHGMSPSVLKKIAEEQRERTKALADSLPNPAVKIKFASWEMVILIPAVLSLTVGRSKLCDGVPVVPVLQLQDFVSQVPVYVNSLEHFQRTLRIGRF